MGGMGDEAPATTPWRESAVFPAGPYPLALRNRYDPIKKSKDLAKTASPTEEAVPLRPLRTVWARERNNHGAGGTWRLLSTTISKITIQDSPQTFLDTSSGAPQSTMFNGCAVECIVTSGSIHLCQCAPAGSSAF